MTSLLILNPRPFDQIFRLTDSSRGIIALLQRKFGSTRGRLPESMALASSTDPCKPSLVSQIHVTTGFEWMA